MAEELHAADATCWPRQDIVHEWVSGASADTTPLPGRTGASREETFKGELPDKKGGTCPEPGIKPSAAKR